MPRLSLRRRPGRRRSCLDRAGRAPQPAPQPGFSMTLSALESRTRSTAVVRLPALPGALQAPTRMARRERPALRSWAHPTPARPAHSIPATETLKAVAHLASPMTGRRWAVARRRRAPGRPSLWRGAQRARRLPVSGPPTQERVGSTKARWALATRGQTAAQPGPRARPALPMTARDQRGRVAGRLEAAARPMRARPLRVATRVRPHPSSAPRPLEPQEIPRLELAPERRRDQAAEPEPPANPRWARDRQAGHRVRPTQVKWLQALRGKLRAGPSLATT